MNQSGMGYFFVIFRALLVEATQIYDTGWITFETIVLKRTG